MKPRIVHYRGMSFTIRQWIKLLHIKNVNVNTIHNRIFLYKWPLDEAFIDHNFYRNKKSPERNDVMWEKRIDNGVEAWQDIMIAKGYFRREHMTKIYKQLNGWYKEFREQDRKAA